MRRAYRFLLRLCLPRTLRKAHGAEMADLFADQVKEAGTRGRLAAWRVALSGMLDVATRAPREHWLRSGPVHSQDKEHPVQSLLIDLRYAFRSFARQPGATALVVATLGLAVAANTSVFALLDSIFRRPFPFPESSRLVYINERAPTWNLEYTNVNYPDFVAWRARANAFESMALFENQSVNLADGPGAERVRGMRVTHDFTTVLKVKLILGRTFTQAEDVPDGPAVVVIGHALWMSRFAGDSAIVGKTLRINSAPHTIIGVFPPEASFPDAAALWLPLGGDPHQSFQNYSYDGIGRLKRGVTVSQAERSLHDAHAVVWAARDTGHVVSPRVEPLRSRFVAEYATAGRALGIAAGLVLLIACANVGGTMLARSIARRKEIGIRVALGASSSRVVRQLLTESLALSAIAGVAGTLVANAGIKLLVRSNPEFMPSWAQPALDAPAVIFSVTIVAAAALFFGLAPTLQLRRHVASGAGTANARVAGSVPERRLLSALVVTEVALSAILLVSGGLLLRAYDTIRHVNPGFRTEGVATFRVSLPRATYAGAIEQFAFYNRMIERLRTIPGVDHVGGATCLPLTCHTGSFFRAEGAPRAAPGASDPVTLTRIATPGYFATMGIVLTRGRLFREGEGGSGRHERVAVVNEQMAERYWPNADAIGKRFAFRADTADSWITVVGVVADVRHYGLAQPMIAGLYLAQTSLESTDDWRSFGFAVHGTADALQLLPAIRTAAREVDPEIPLFDVRTLRASLDRSMSQQRMIAFSLSVFAAVALGLAMGGIYAVLSYVVGRRRREIAIRMALGARREQVLRSVLRQGLVLTAIGVLIGVPVAIVASQAMKGLLAGMSGSDPLTYGVAVLVLFIVASVAAAIPAARAAGLEPKAVLSEST